jgi:DNA gyrase inhibitor GyrI
MATNHLASANEVACARMTGKPEAALVKCCNQAISLIDQRNRAEDPSKSVMGIFHQLPEVTGRTDRSYPSEIALLSTTMKAKKPTIKQVQGVRCPTCGAGPGEKCELSTGQPRTEPHRDRRLIATD